MSELRDPAAREQPAPPAQARDLLVVIPAWNEQSSVGHVIAEIGSACPQADVLVVDDGSTDATAKVARHAGAAVLSLPYNLGVGGAMRAGFRYALRAGYRVVVQVDADGQHDPAAIAGLVDMLDGADGQPGADVVVGARFAGEGAYKVGKARWFAMRLLARLLSRITKTRLTDATSGFRATGPRALPLFARSYPTEYLGDTIESLVIAARSGCVCRQVPVVMRPRYAGTPSQSAWKSFLYLARAFLVLMLAAIRRWPQLTDEPVLDAGAPRLTLDLSFTVRPLGLEGPGPAEGGRVIRTHVIAAVGGLLVLAFMLELLRRRQLREKYAILWLLVSIVVVVLAAFPSLLNWVGARLGISDPPNLLFFGAVIVLLLVTVHLSWEASRLEEETRTLAEEVALLRMQVDALQSTADGAIGEQARPAPVRARIPS